MLLGHFVFFTSDFLLHILEVLKIALVLLLFILKKKVIGKLNRNLQSLVGLLTDRCHFVIVRKMPGPSNIKNGSSLCWNSKTDSIFLVFQPNMSSENNSTVICFVYALSVT